MYGLVNRSLEDHVRRQRGDACWATIKEHAGVGLETFIGIEQYDDQITHRLIDAAIRTLGCSYDEFLEGVGRGWVQTLDERGFSDLLDFAGRSLEELLLNVDSLHARLTMTFPELAAPSFFCQQLGPSHYRIAYSALRPRMTPFFAGMLHGLALRFGHEVTVDVDKPTADGLTKLDIRVEPASGSLPDSGKTHLSAPTPRPTFEEWLIEEGLQS